MLSIPGGWCDVGVSLQRTVFFYIQLQCRMIPSVVLPYCIAMHYDVL